MNLKKTMSSIAAILVTTGVIMHEYPASYTWITKINVNDERQKEACAQIILSVLTQKFDYNETDYNFKWDNPNMEKELKSFTQKALQRKPLATSELGFDTRLIHDRGSFDDTSEIDNIILNSTESFQKVCRPVMEKWQNKCRRYESDSYFMKCTGEGYEKILQATSEFIDTKRKSTLVDFTKLEDLASNPLLQDFQSKYSRDD